MRLNTIKLSGFKSFADPTQFALPGQLVGVVGPNGCGKSNIMDAVRWVLGESKASELRGDSMQDVIFNGASGRKPAGRASVELVFGNALGRAGGPWGRYAEIAVKRVLSRDGASTYSINGQVVRRRDVQDVFLGTGLGPRAYAIIGQGTISRIIESRPEELRLFLEEAAGVSKYKERRRETEAKLRDTRDNLVRVADILRELNTQVAKLGTQAGVAQRYQHLTRLARVRRHQWWFLQQRRAAAEAARLLDELRSAETALASRTAELRHVEAALAELHVARDAAADVLHRSSGRATEAALEVSRLEERARQMADARRRLVERQAATEVQRTQWQARLDTARAELDEAMARTGELDALATLTGVTAEAHTASLPTVVDGVAAARRRLGDSQDALVAIQQQLQLLAAESRHLATQRQQLDAQHARLVDEQRRLVLPDVAQLDALRRRVDDADAAVAEAQQRQQRSADEAPGLEAQRRTAQAHARDAETRATAVAARRSALEAVQARLQSSSKQAPWLARLGLAGAAPLWQQMRIAAGWEPALEAVLRERLGAYRVASYAALAAAGEGDPPPVKTVLYVLPELDEAQAPSERAIESVQERSPPSLASPSGRALVDLVEIDAGLRPLLADWLGPVQCCVGLSEALAQQPALGDGEMLVTPDGHLVRRWSVALYAPDAEQAGLLARARDIAALQVEAATERTSADAAARELAVAEAACQSAAAVLSAARTATAAVQAEAHRLQVELVRASQQAEQANALAARLDAQIADAAAGRDRVLGQAASVQQRSAEVDAQLGPLQQAHAQSQTELQAAERRLAEARDEQRRLDRLAQDAAYAARSGSARVAECRRALAAAEQQVSAVEQQLLDLQDDARQLDDAAVDAALHAALARRLACEAELAAARDAADSVAQQWRRADETRLQHQQALQPLHDATLELQLQAQAADIAEAQFGEQLDGDRADRAQLAQSVQDDAVVEADLPAEIDRLDKQAAALGAVNLAAVDELAAAEERKGFLDAQCRDLEAAMATLEGAIRTIDLETRELLGSTFDQVNAQFGRLFPVLFGGGEARLAMTGAEILDAGVQVLAQPPGKKNSSIALLSGGEKALTAIALVFAIFHLNPAPFCLLDEVDAPLDDANTERYARLVRDMSAGTQFLFISHNRIAMEMAGQLIGVTMQEQGVSRIVAVDVNSTGLVEPVTA